MNAIATASVKNESARETVDIALSLCTADIRNLLEKVMRGDELSFGQALHLATAEGSDLQALVAVADHLRRETVGEIVTYVVNRNINFTNVCFVGCSFCGFGRGPQAADAYSLSFEEVVRRAQEAWDCGATEVCIQGGLPRDLDGFYYRDLLRAIKRAIPAMHVHAFSPMEIDYGVLKTGMPLRDYLQMMKGEGLGSIPGTAAEILDDRIRQQLSPNKLPVARWVEIITTAHELGIPTTSTMMYGHVEEPADWVRHLLLLRSIQKRTSGFTEFVPLGFIHQNTRLYKHGGARPGAVRDEHLRVHALSRVLLHGAIRNVQVSWVKLGIETSLACLQAGGQRAGKKITYEYEDVEAVRDEVPLVRAVSAESCSDFGYKVSTRVVSIQTRGVEFPYGQMRKLELEDGRYFNEGDFVDHRRVVILGSKAAKKAFQGAPSVGQFLSIGGQQFEVIGVLRNKIQDSMYQGPDNEDGFIPFQVYRELKQVRDPDMIVIQPQAAELNKKALAAVREVIARRHHFDPKDDKATPVWDTIEDRAMINAFSLGLQAVLGLIGAVTLAVGGVGVMNIMLVSVTERTREIGLRKALGARPRHILVQFLLEALVLTFAGGLIGMAVAVILTWIIPPMPLYGEIYKTANHEGDIFLHASSTVMMVSFIILSMIGIISGFFPALKAARMDPVEALHYE